jgi:hypothetical protein
MPEVRDQDENDTTLADPPDLPNVAKGDETDLRPGAMRCGSFACGKYRDRSLAEVARLDPRNFDWLGRQLVLPDARRVIQPCPRSSTKSRRSCCRFFGLFGPVPASVLPFLLPGPASALTTIEEIHMSELTQTPEPADQLQSQRQRLAVLIGRLLARYWLRHRKDSLEPESEPKPNPPRTQPNAD